MTLWAWLAYFQLNPKGWDYPEMLQKLFLADDLQPSDRGAGKIPAEIRGEADPSKAGGL
jgi:hypothetical protein